MAMVLIHKKGVGCCVATNKFGTYVECKSKHGDVCARQILGLNQFPGEKSLRCPDVMGTRLQMQTVKI